MSEPETLPTAVSRGAAALPAPARPLNTRLAALIIGALPATASRASPLSHTTPPGAVRPVSSTPAPVIPKAITAPGAALAARLALSWVSWG